MDNLKFDHDFFGSVVHSSSGLSSYVRHNVCAWCKHTELGYLEFQTGVSFLGDDYNTPSANLELYSHDDLSEKVDFCIRNYGLEDKHEDYIKEEAGITFEEYARISNLLNELEIEAQRYFDDLGLDNNPENYIYDEYQGTWSLKSE